MKKIVVIFILEVFILPIFGQNSPKTKEIRIRNNNSFMIFNICIDDCSTTFDKNKTYSWYSEITQSVKKTIGGAGGKLLHGNYTVYYENGDLFQTTNYYLGLEDGTFTQWDEFGKINFIQKQDKGVTIYYKIQDDDKYWIEMDGPMFKKGTVKRVYNQFNYLISEETYIDISAKHVKIFYENSHQLKEDYIENFDDLYGKYTMHYKNGKIKVRGQFLEYNSKTVGTVKVGTWNWYSIDGTLTSSENYKAISKQQDDIAIKNNFVRIEELVFDTSKNIWVKTGKTAIKSIK